MELGELVKKIRDLSKKRDKNGNRDEAAINQFKQELKSAKKCIDFVSLHQLPDGTRTLVTPSFLIAMENDTQTLDFLVREFDVDPGWIRQGFHKGGHPIEIDYKYGSFQNQPASNLMGYFMQKNIPFPYNKDLQEIIDALDNEKRTNPSTYLPNLTVQHFAMINDQETVNRLLAQGFGTVKDAIEGYAIGGHIDQVEGYFAGNSYSHHNSEHVRAAIEGYTKGGHYHLVGEILPFYPNLNMSLTIKEVFDYESSLRVWHYHVMQILHHFPNDELKRNLVNTDNGSILVQEHFQRLSRTEKENFYRYPVRLVDRFIEKFVIDSNNIAQLMRDKNVSFNVAYAALCPAMQHVNAGSNLENFKVDARGPLNTDSHERPIFVSKTTAETAYQLYTDEKNKLNKQRFDQLKDSCQAYLNHLISDQIYHPGNAIKNKLEKIQQLWKILNNESTLNAETIAELEPIVKDQEFRDAVGKHRPKNVATQVLYSLFKYKTDGQKLLEEADALLDSSNYQPFHQSSTK